MRFSALIPVHRPHSPSKYRTRDVSGSCFEDCGLRFGSVAFKLAETFGGTRPGCVSRLFRFAVGR